MQDKSTRAFFHNYIAEIGHIPCLLAVDIGWNSDKPVSIYVAAAK